ncbi:BlaI/MecI/CopY family transcriptional regulator [Actinomadura sp. 3N407]|uniref:BlaI/MecI/CopY family transcriptional regulator n=1 Tax=Actinomadura sp. 3N407 TaxID=3457423 RepID=UPI003FCDDCFD
MSGPGGELTKLLGPLGAEVMAELWAADEPLPVRGVLDRLNRRRDEQLAYTTVMTVLGRLAARGAATRTAAGRGYLYQAAVRDAAELAVKDVVRDHGAAAVTYFVDQMRAEPQLRHRLERLLDSSSPEAGEGS